MGVLVESQQSTRSVAKCDQDRCSITADVIEAAGNLDQQSVVALLKLGRAMEKLSGRAVLVALPKDRQKIAMRNQVGGP